MLLCGGGVAAVGVCHHHHCFVGRRWVGFVGGIDLGFIIVLSLGFS